MFDISWSEFLLIGVVALIVIGPKELPTVMRTLGQWTRKVRVMANEFQNQFQEAIREAELGDLKKQVDDLAEGVTNYDPLKSAREDLENVHKDIERSLHGAPADETPALPDPAANSAEPALIEAAVPEALDAPAETLSLPRAAEEPALPPPPHPVAEIPASPPQALTDETHAPAPPTEAPAAGGTAEPVERAAPAGATGHPG
jgi:sec-independent protein translocase protein TatB